MQQNNGNMTQREGIHKFENERIKTLQEERLHIQKKTFTKWMNSFLAKAKMEVDDLFIDLADGIKLLKLLEIISGEKLGKPNNGRMRVHKIENVNKSLAFLHTKVRLESIGAEDIVDGNPRLILGLIWTIILRFQIQEIEIDVDEDNESSEKRSAKDALLLWCQRKTYGYQGVSIHDFTASWRSGLGFNALIHSHRPDLFDYSKLVPGRNIDNLNHAFNVANDELGINRLLDAEDVDTARPDEKSILTYVASYYHTFARMKNEQKSGKRIANIVGKLMDADRRKALYERLTTNLLSWIRQTTTELEKRNFPNSLEGIQKQLLSFKQYRTIEKPPKYKERSEIEALYFTINTLLKTLHQPHYTPQDGQLINDIEKAWQRLENAEHHREVALREELLRQEKLEQLNYKFEKKSILREGYLKEMIQVLSDPRYGASFAQVDATVKKHEAISADILARVERFNDLTAMAEELEKENYHGKERVKKRESEVLEKWRKLLELLENHKNNLGQMSSLMSLLREIDATLISMHELKTQFASEDVGPHSLGVEEFLQAHSLQELQVHSLGETQRRFIRQGQAIKHANQKDIKLLEKSLSELDKTYSDLQKACAQRRNRLEEARNFYLFLEDYDNEVGWLVEKQRICKTGISAKDLRAVVSLQQKHKALEDEIKVREPKSTQMIDAGRKLISENHLRQAEIKNRVESLQEHWKSLQELVDLRRRQLEDASEAYQFYTDANEAESWLNEKITLLESTDYGVDEPSAQALLHRHRDLQGELNAYMGDILNLNQQAEKLIKAGICTLDLQTAEPEPMLEAEQEEWVNETRLVQKEVWEEEPVEKIEHRMVTENKYLPHVRAAYAFEGQGMTMSKGEILILLNKTNEDWWSIRKMDGSEGFVPANYVKEIEARLVPCLEKRIEKIRTVQKVKKSILVRQVVPVKRIKPTKVSQVRPLVKRRPANEANDSSDSVEKRQKRVNSTYDQLQLLAQKRYALLEDSICLFGFYRECDDFEKWIKDKEKMLQSEELDDTDVETAKRKFEKFLTDLSASSKRIEAIDFAVEDFIRQGHSQLDKVKQRQRQIYQQWENLNKLKAQKEKNLEGASSVELFNRTCDEAIDWMNEKMTQLDIADVGPDLKTVQALQRRHQHLERELAPLEEKITRVNLLGNSVKNSYPNEQSNVTNRQKEIKEMWQRTQDKARERRSRLESAVGQQIFINSSKSLLAWIESIKDTLLANEKARDVETAENLLKKHNELGDEIKAQNDEFKEVIALGKQLQQRNTSNLTDVVDLIERLGTERDGIHSKWLDKQNQLQQGVELQVFNREADKIDATTKSHEAFLEYTNLGNSLDEVEAIIKRHNDFENTLGAQNKIIKHFSDNADKLIENGHYNSDYINKRRIEVIMRRNAVKESAQKRKTTLQASKDYEKFRAEAGDLNTWLDDKMRVAGDENYRDLSNLPWKLQKHKAFERELRANEGQLRNINKDADNLISSNNRVPEVKETCSELNKKWKKLLNLSQDKGKRLQQAVSQRDHNRCIEDAKKKLHEFEGALLSKDVGHDLRSCKEFLNRQQMLESEIYLWQQKIDELVSCGEEMAHEGHFDSNNIKSETKDIQEEFKKLALPIQNRRAFLEESLKFHNFVFELDAEIQWINEHLPAATSTELGQNLHQAQSLQKKHNKLQAEINGHEPTIKKTLNSGQGLTDQNHPEEEKVRELCEVVASAWNDLVGKTKERSGKLDLSLKAQQYLSEAGEIETWLVERTNVLKSTDFGRDRDSATKLLTKHKGIELELDTYSGIISEMGHTAASMIVSKHPDSKLIASKQQMIEKMFKSLQRLSGQRQIRLMESMYRHEYFAECAELEQWIKELEQAASSEDYGQDYEHLLLLQNKFDDLKHRVESGVERFNQCNDFAKKLLASESPYIADIEKCQDQLSTSWQNLLQLIALREQKLRGAGEIHRFYRDVTEAIFRIQDKNAAISTEMGKDLNSALALHRKHEGFENDLVALEAQLQVLVEDSTRLQKKYPTNTTAIRQQHENVVKAWEKLKERSALRSDQLAASCDLQTFLTQVRDLMLWASNLRATLQAEEHVRDAAGATALKIQHDAIYNEIEAREEKFRYLSELSDSMVQTGHYAAAEVEERCSALLDERSRLHTAWNKKKVLLEQKIDLYCFLRDAKQIDSLCISQEASLGSTNLGQTVEAVQDQIKRHDAFEKFIQTQEEKVALLQEHGGKLLEQNHYDSGRIDERLREVIERRQKVKRLCSLQRQKLDDALLYAQFVRDCAEAELWISEKHKKLGVDGDVNVDTDLLEDKIKKLQKHQALQAEVAANQERIIDIKKTGEILINKNHENVAEIKEVISKVLTAWRELLKELDQRGRGLEEAQDILEFNNQLDKIEAWIRDKELMVQAKDSGKDLEHCTQLIRKLDDVDSDMRVDDQRIKTINTLADKLMNQEQAPNALKSVQQRRNNFNSKWRALQGALGAYRFMLSGAHEIHAFNRDTTDTSERIAEKSILLNSDDRGRDLAQVQTLLRKQEALERDMSAIHTKLMNDEKQANKLKEKYPENSDDIDQKLDELRKSWENLKNTSVKRKQILNDAYKVHKLAADVKEIEQWVNDIIKKMDSAPTPTTITESESQLELHQERKAEIDGRDEMFKILQSRGEELKANKDSVTEDVSITLKLLDDMKNSVRNEWQLKEEQLREAHELQQLKHQTDQIEIWLANKEAFLNNDDLGDSYTAVEALIKKHEAFEKLLKSDNVDHLEQFAKKISSKYPNQKATIEMHLNKVLIRKEKLLDRSKNRKKKLEESFQLQQLLRSLYEVERWLSQKLQIALDESYREPSNLQSKIQKHAVFDSELNANTSRVEAVIAEGVGLVDAKHFASKEIISQLEILENDWQRLQESSRNKKDRLSEAYEALIFNRSLDEFNRWMDEVESHLSSEDYGKDLASVNNLVKKHELLEADVNRHSEVCDTITETDTKFFNSNHFMKDEIHEKAMLAVKRYHSLHEPMTIRRDNLEDSLQLHHFFRDAEDELQWLNEKEALASSKDLGTSLSSVQSLQKKHQALEAEILSQEPLISSLIQRGQQMIRDGHFASEDIETLSNLLQNKLSNLRDLTSIRRLRLLDAVESQMFYVEANEADIWMKEKYPIFTSTDYGKDEDSVQSLQKKLDAVQRELTTFATSIGKVEKLASGLIERKHFDSENIKNKNDSIQNLYEEMKTLAKQRESRLIESKKLYKFLREIEEVHEWVADQMAVTASEDYGEDVEHIEQLIVSFESFVLNLTANENRISSAVIKGETLIAEKSPYCTTIKTKVGETTQLWEELKDLVSARQEALAGAKQVHVYDRRADETISWISEKDAALLSEDYGQDLETIQALVRKQEVFETELGAVKEQVNAVVDEAKRLAEIYPDAKEHIEVKRDETIEMWTELLEKTATRKIKLKQAEQLQAYFDEYRDLMAWINEMIAKITAPDLATNVAAAEALLARIKEHRTEIDSRKDAFDNFYKNGHRIISEKHFLSNEIQDKITVLRQRHELLETTLQKRHKIYELNLDTQLFLREAEVLESWIHSREPQLKDHKMGENIAQVEELIRRHEDFEKTVEAQEDKFQALKRITLLESLFKKQKEDELAAKRAEKERIEKERLETIKQREVKRITEERRRNEKVNISHDQSLEADDSQRIAPVPLQQSASHDGVAMTNSNNTVQKSSSIVNLFGERLRRGSDSSNVKRAESMKIGPKLPKRTPSFTTRRRAQSFRKNQHPDQFDLPPVEIQGMLERKHELQSGGKKAPVRSWKPLHTVLCGQLLCFFKDEEDFYQKKGASSPVNILNSRCEKADDYTKKKHVFRLHLPDGSEFLFLTANEVECLDWINKISFHASLPPNLQLTPYQVKQTQTNSPVVEVSPISSRTSSPDSQRRSSRQDSMSSTVSTGSGLSTPQTTFLQKTKELREQQASTTALTSSTPQAHVQSTTVYSADKPPIPPRGLPPPVPQRQISTSDSVQLRNRSTDGSSNYGNVQNRPHSTDYQNNSSNDQYNQQHFKMGWGATRFDANTRPLSLQHEPSSSRISAESSSESEAQSTISTSSVVSGGSKDKDKKSGVFRLFSKKKRSSQLN
ncbi:spectrin beta chain, non-erythrocytic 1 isoform X4 [Sitodiplosis mosellana]|uniref:spectrin beta chain, non-erythrocytic 1 isoform X4 n=1 Tax=Sitodiplosis mosellana TaxID=263140 RepID=UPI002444F0E9|nr:spectrin beta chain, non-erythrocytic 1 isoform X4 [Sitodiplosis mosellana]